MTDAGASLNLTKEPAQWDFLRGFFANPWKVASPIPSSRRLAAKIAQEVDVSQVGTILELGPGTGVVTRAILNRGISPDNLITIESDPNFVTLLRRSFAGVTTLNGDAFDFETVLRENGVRAPLRTIVCGVPVLSQSPEVRRAFLTTAMQNLASGCPFVQFTYGLRPPIAPFQGVQVRHASALWFNLPPMHVWTYRSC